MSALKREVSFEELLVLIKEAKKIYVWAELIQFQGVYVRVTKKAIMEAINIGGFNDDDFFFISNLSPIGCLWILLSPFNKTK